MAEKKKALVYFDLYEIVGNIRSTASTFRKMIHDGLSEKYHTFDGIILGGKNVRVVGMSIPSISKNAKYPVLKNETPGFIYLYVYFIHSDYIPVTMERYTFERQPTHFLTFTNLVQKMDLHDKISKLREMLIMSNNLGIVDCEISNDSILTENKVVNPFMSDQGINIFDYIDLHIIDKLPDKEPHFIDKILKDTNVKTLMVKLINEIVDTQHKVIAEKKMTAYKDVDSIKDKDIHTLVTFYNKFIELH